MLEGLGARVGLRNAGPPISDRAINWLDVKLADEPLSILPPSRKISAVTPACVMFTSGSTGRPKGVEVPHRAIVRLVFGQDFARMGPAETWLHMAPTSFDASTLEIWGALLHGGRLVLMPPGVPSLQELAATLESQRVTSLWLTAGLFHQMVEDDLYALAPVRQLLAGGPSPSQEVRQEELARRVRLALDGLAEADRQVLLLRTVEGL